MDKTNGERKPERIELERISVLELTYNHTTCQVAIGGKPMPISLAQIILGEAMRLLEEQRRLALAQQLQQQAQQALENARIAEMVRNKKPV